jgi:hypothetical protein
LVYNQAVNTLFFQIRGDGLMTMNNSGMTISNVSGSSAIPLVVDAPVGNWGIELLGSATANQSYGLLIESGTSQSDYAIYVGNHGNTAQIFQVFGDGSVCLNEPATPKGVGTINVSGGYYIAGINQFQNGSFTGTLTGCTTSPTATMYYSSSGNTCTISLPTNLLGTSSSTTCTITGLPAACTPARTQTCYAPVENISSPTYAGNVQISGTTMTFGTGLTGAGGFTNSATSKGALTFTYTYPLN